MHHLVGLDFESQPISPPSLREDQKQEINSRAGTGNGGDSASDNDLGQEQEETVDQNIQETKQIDDVYDLNAVKP
jgi:hypothetical protein